MWIRNPASSGADACLRKSDSTPLKIQLALWCKLNFTKYQNGPTRQETSTHWRCSSLSNSSSKNDDGTNTG